MSNRPGPGGDAGGRIPFTVIGGFLGAGKTTLLNHWLTDPQGERLAVLVNDFGAVNVDAALLAPAGANGDPQVMALSNGCVCCSIGGDLADALARVMDRQGAVDRIVVEASGVSDPWRIAQVALADPQLMPDGVVVLVDATTFLDQLADPLLTDSLLRQLHGADVLVVHKIDAVPAAHLQALEERLATLAPGTPRIAAAHGQVPRAVLCGPTVAPGGLLPSGDPGHDQRFESWHCQLLRRPEPQELRHWLGQAPAGLLRLKGCLPCADGRWMELQWAGRHGSVKPALRVPDDGAVVVAIGLRGQLPRAALAQMFAWRG